MNYFIEKNREDAKNYYQYPTNGHQQSPLVHSSLYFISFHTVVYIFTITLEFSPTPPTKICADFRCALNVFFVSNTLLRLYKLRPQNMYIHSHLELFLTNNDITRVDIRTVELLLHSCGIKTNIFKRKITNEETTV